MQNSCSVKFVLRDIGARFRKIRAPAKSRSVAVFARYDALKAFEVSKHQVVGNWMEVRVKIRLKGRQVTSMEDGWIDSMQRTATADRRSKEMNG